MNINDLSTEEIQTEKNRAIIGDQLKQIQQNMLESQNKIETLRPQVCEFSIPIYLYQIDKITTGFLD